MSKTTRNATTWNCDGCEARVDVPDEDLTRPRGMGEVGPYQPAMPAGWSILRLACSPPLPLDEEARDLCSKCSERIILHLVSLFGPDRPPDPEPLAPESNESAAAVLAAAPNVRAAVTRVMEHLNRQLGDVMLVPASQMIVEQAIATELERVSGRLGGMFGP